MATALFGLTMTAVLPGGLYRSVQRQEVTLGEVQFPQGGREALIDAIDEDGHEGDAQTIDLDAEV